MQPTETKGDFNILWQFRTLFEWVMATEPGEIHRSGLSRDELVRLVDTVLVQAARFRGSWDLAIGELLAQMDARSLYLELGYSNLGDYARERLEIPGGTARTRAKLARDLHSRPLLCEAVMSGSLSARKAQVVAPVATGEDEARWLAVARRSTVRQLQDMVRAEREDAGHLETEWERLEIWLRPEERDELREAMKLARYSLGGKAHKWQCLEVIAQEFLSSFPVEEPEEVRPAYAWQLFRSSQDEWATRADGRLGVCSALPEGDDVPAAEVEVPSDSHRLDAELRRLARIRDHWDAALCRLLHLTRSSELWRDLGFESFAAYCTERLGMGRSAACQRAGLERAFLAAPLLKEAFVSGRLGYEKARLLSRIRRYGVTEAQVAWAASHTCQEVQHAVDAMRNGTCPSPLAALGDRVAEEAPSGFAPVEPPIAAAGTQGGGATPTAETTTSGGPTQGGPAGSEATAEPPRDAVQMCARRGPARLSLVSPTYASDTVELAIWAVQHLASEAGEGPLFIGTALAVLARHFKTVWKRAVRLPSRKARGILERKGDSLCQVPGCTHQVDDRHHVVFRSHGGGDAPSNFIAVCSTHHHRCIHAGYLRVTGLAPDRLRFEFGMRDGVPLFVIEPETVRWLDA